MKPYKINTGCDENIMPIRILKILFPRAMKEQLGRCKIEIEHYKQITCEFFVVPGNGQALLGISDIENLDVLSIN